jgi:hypothetical protein
MEGSIMTEEEKRELRRAYYTSSDYRARNRSGESDPYMRLYSNSYAQRRRHDIPVYNDGRAAAFAVPSNGNRRALPIKSRIIISLKNVAKDALIDLVRSL